MPCNFDLNNVPVRSPIALPRYIFWVGWIFHQLAFTALLGFGQESPSLDPRKQLSQYVHESWFTEEGVFHRSISSLTQTPDGYLWLGTEDGLVRFDGRQHTVFDRRSTSAFEVNAVTSLAVTKKGAIWIGTRGGGLLKFENHRFSSIDSSSGLTDANVTALLEDRNGDLWIGTHGKGLHRKRGEVFTSFSEEQGYENASTTSLLEDTHGRLWVGTDLGLFRRLGRRIERFPGTPVSEAAVTLIFEDRNGRLWIGTREDGLFEWRDGSWRQYAGLLTAQGPVVSMAQDSGGNLWLGLTNGQLVRFSPGRNEPYELDALIEGKALAAMIPDLNGGLWLGGRDGRLHRLRDEKFTPVGRTEGLADDRTYSLYGDQNNSVWVGTAAGLQHVSPYGLIPFPTERVLTGKSIRTVFGDGEGGVWAGTERNGLYRVRGSLVKSYTSASGLAGNHIAALFLDRQGRLWIGTESGVSIFDGRHFTNLNREDGLPSADITAIAPHHTGAMWIGTRDAGLLMYKAGLFRRIGQDRGLSRTGITALYEDGNGVLWAGTEGNGLVRIKGDSITQYTRHEGLHSNFIYSILEDDAERLWLNSDRGIFCVAKAGFEAIAAGADSLVAATAFDRSDGLRTARVAGGQQPSAWKSGDGRLWFATLEGVVSIDPVESTNSAPRPPVVIQAITIDGVRMPPTRDLVLPAGAHRLIISFASPGVAVPDRIRFSYELEGVDAGWSPPGALGQAHYTDLAPGAYTFRVKAGNTEGYWNESPATLSLYLRPSFYQTYWFRFALFVGLIFAVYAGYRFQIRSMETRRQELETSALEKYRELRMEIEKTVQARRVIEEQADELRNLDRFKTHFVANISHEFRTPLTMIIGPLENALGGSYGPLDTKLFRQVRIMLRNAQRLFRLINQMLDLSLLGAGKTELQSQRRNLVPFLESLLLSCTPLADKKAIQLEFRSERPEIILYFEPDKLEKVFFNLLSNSLKFTSNGGVIGFEVNEGPETAAFPNGCVEIAVFDTGRGIPEKEIEHVFDRFHQVDESVTREFEGSGIGLALVNELILLHKGAIEVTSEVGVGTRFTIRLPKGSSHLRADQINGELLDPAFFPVSSASVISELATESMGFDHENDDIFIRFDAPVRDDLLGEKLVLIVDDNPDVREYVSSILSEQYTIETAVDGVDGLEKARRLRPDLIISDVMMPRMDGNELCRTIKENLDLDHIPVILLTARATNELRIEGLEMGADDYLTKPFNARELLVRSRNLMLMRHQEKELKLLNEDLEEKVAEQLRQMLNERIKYEEELLDAKDRAELSSHLKSTILDNINHEFRTPIAGIIGSADILAMEAPTRLQEFVGYIKQSTHRLQNTLDAVVELSSLESNQFTLSLHSIDLREAVRDAEERYSPYASSQGLAVSAQLPESSVIVSTDVKALSKILDHVLDNAVKFTPEGSITLSLTTDSEWAHLAIEDTGIGINEDFMPQLFDAFVQESDGLARSYEGIGIGLSISKRLTERMGGKLEVQSVKGQGSTFTVSFPLVTKRKAQPASS